MSASLLLDYGKLYSTLALKHMTLRNGIVFSASNIFYYALRWGDPATKESRTVNHMVIKKERITK